MKFAVTAVPVTFPERKPVNWVLAVTKLAVTAVPVTFPDKKPVNWVLAVTKLAVTAVPDRLPVKNAATVGTVSVFVLASKLMFASVTKVKPKPAVFTFTNVG